jgi:hypothetical protein
MEELLAPASVLDEQAAARGLVRLRRDSGVMRLNQLITETLADFDAECASAPRLKAAVAHAPVKLPRSWAKKVG